MVGMQSNEIGDAKRQYEIEAARQKEEMERQLNEGGSKRGAVAAWQRRKAAIERQIKIQEAKNEIASSDRELAADRLRDAQEEATKSSVFNARITRELAKLSVLEEKTEFKADLEKLKGLVLLNESLKNQESQFKANCKRQLQSLQGEIKKLEGTAPVEDVERLEEIEKMHAEMLAKYNKLRQLLATRNQAIASTSRLIDDVPSRTELIQYERRFVELYEQVAAKLEETRKYFQMYNTLDEKHKFLNKEVTLINSISDNFETAMGSKENKLSFLDQFEKIIGGVKQNLVKQESAAQEKKKQAANLTAQHQLVCARALSEFVAL
jgi:hypothetical protein